MNEGNYIMIGSKTLQYVIIALAVVLPINTAVALESGVFVNKSFAQHGLTEWEKDKMNAEFKNNLSPARPGSGAKMGSNPWDAKKVKKQQHNMKMLQLSNSWGSCREFSYKQRGQCYARGGDAYTCERYYDARVAHCNNSF